VIIQGAKTSLVTDSLGKFRIDSLPPGTYQIGVFHPMLDTLGISLASQPFHVGPDSSSYLVLSVPSAATIIRRACPVRGFRPQGTSAVIGHVTDPETLQPVPGAEVSIAWDQLEVSKEIGVRRTPRVIRDSTDEHGQYRLCGLPNSMKATVQARKAGAVTAEIPIVLGDEESELFARTLLLSRADSGAKTGNAIVSGRVILEGSPTLAGSRVEVVGTDVVTLTNEKTKETQTWAYKGGLRDYLMQTLPVDPVIPTTRQPSSRRKESTATPALAHVQVTTSFNSGQRSRIRSRPGGSSSARHASSDRPTSAGGGVRTRSAARSSSG